MTGYPAIRVSAKIRLCCTGGCHIETGERYLRVFFPPDDIFKSVYVSHRCRNCAVRQGYGGWFGPAA